MDDADGPLDEKQVLWNNDFEIVEHDSESSEDISTQQETEVGKCEPSGFPKVRHRSLHAYNLSRSNESGLNSMKSIEEMTSEEIESAQKFLREKLGEEMCNFIIQRKLKRLSITKEDEKHKYTPDSKEDTPTSEPQHGLILKFSKDEEDKYIWMNPIESNGPDKGSGELMLHELRFNFDGMLLKPEDPDVTNYDPSLYNHGMDPNKPGYTIPELIRLLQSSFKPQVQIAIRTLCNIIHNAYIPKATSNSDTELGCKYYFGYSYDRWNSYINNDVDLISKIGHTLCSSQTSVNTLVDLLRCLSLLVFGECDPSEISALLPNCLSDNFIIPIQDAIFDTYHSPSGLDIYHWNSLCIELSSADVYKSLYGETNKQVDNNERTMRLQIFFSKALDGCFEELHMRDIKKEIFKIFQSNFKTSEEEEEYLQIDSKIFLLTKCNIVKKLVLMMEQYKENAKIQLYSTNVLCGLMSYFGTYFTNVLVTKKYLITHYKWLMDCMTSCAQGMWRKKFKEDETQLITSLIFFIKYISIYSKNSFKTFCDDCGSLALIQQTIMLALKVYLESLNLATFIEKGGDTKSFVYNFPASIGLKCLTIWSMKDEYVEPFVELIPLMEWTLFTILGYLQTNIGKFKDYVNVYGHLLSVINLHTASYIEHNGSSDYFEFSGVVVRGVGTIKEIVNIIDLTWDWNILLLIFSIIKLQVLYINNHVKDSVPDPYKEDKQIAARIFGKENVDNTLNLSIRLCEYFLNNTISGFPSELNEIGWETYRTAMGSQKAIHNYRKSTNLIVSFLLPVQIATATIDFLKHPRLVKHMPRLKKIKIYSQLFNRIIDVLKDFYLSLNTKGFVGIVKSTPTIEPWLRYLYELSNVEVENNIDGLLCVLAFTCDYDLLTKSLSICADKIGLSKDIVSRMVTEYKAFNDNSALVMGYISPKTALIPFLGYITYFPLKFRDSGEPSNFNDYYSLILSEKIKDKLLSWICPYNMFVKIACTASILSYENGFFIDGSTYFYSALEFFVFSRISFNVHHKEEGNITNDAKHIDCKDWWISQLEKHLSKSQSGDINPAKNNICVSNSEGFICKYFNSTEEIVRVIQNLKRRFNSGAGDSALIMGMLMIFVSKNSIEECSKHIWADITLMTLIGRNTSIDPITMEVTCNSTDTLKLGHISTFLPVFNNSPDILNSQKKLITNLTDETVINYNAITFMVLSSLLSHCSKEHLQETISSTNSQMIEEIIRHFI
ncbi:RPAP1-like, C-terminal domain-containing protein [Theileria equi strain WA]|uniref:RPAP1-like, C-terminal domain-containing protein n=1 Tax=Theileria equi strain WA TaxID=1537102 RepID=L0B0V1_THEEQ|nr:RPAP1-like, C-terminal domain-containing protein [Theileria equi strain WA]AFZ81143.1 RPAP1-like, C-terminal domain-containing protein [Theileria equi strain WA]|eukprot:XP_004830809.1 RPAP1-like, C-terminal domain-containing protein [Theileria equi strain WA]